MSTLTLVSQVVVDGGSSAATNKGGKYNIQNVAEGPRLVTVSAQGFDSQILEVTVDAGSTVTLDFTLAAGG